MGNSALGWGEWPDLCPGCFNVIVITGVLNQPLSQTFREFLDTRFGSGTKGIFTRRLHEKSLMKLTMGDELVK
jgi:hypothetical protein